MASFPLLFSILSIQFMLLLLHLPISYASPLCLPHESSALLHFRSSFTIDNSLDDYYYYSCHDNGYRANTRTWKNGTDCCSWDGITCDTVSGHVIGLDITCGLLQGNFHPNSSLFFLTHLRKLNLAFNEFFPSQIPSGISRLGSLTHLNLSSSGFVGELPSEISHLSKLVSLDLSSYQYVGGKNMEVEASTWKRLMQNMTDLKELILDGADMSSITPNYLSLLVNLSSSLVTLSLRDTGLVGNFGSEILCLPKLQELYLSGSSSCIFQLPKSSCSSTLRFLALMDCELEGSIVILSNFTQLTSLTLGEGNLNSQILSSLSNLQHLTFLDISRSNLNGQIPSSLSNLQHLTSLDLSRNSLNGQIPSSLSNLQHLTYLDLSLNNFSGQIPDEFGQLRKLEYLKFYENSLGGQLPSSLFDLPQLQFLDCSFNKLDGPLPNKITGHPNLYYLDLCNNHFTGTIPSWVSSLQSLENLYLRNNQFTGPIGAFLNFVNLTHLMLSSNNFSGSVEFHHFFKLQNLELLDISNNNFLSVNLNANVNYSFPQLEELNMSASNMTTQPKFFGQLPRLRILDLSNTSLSGEVPKWLLEAGNDSLQYLNLSQNLLTSLERFSSPSLRVLDLSSNLLSGEISSICSASSLELINLSYNKFTGTIPQCIETFSNLSILDLRMNKLSGTLPNCFSNLNGLKILYLNGNWFEGPLPQSLAQCKELSVLDVGNNLINDTFPHWLEPLPWLSILVLRTNKFHGIIKNFKTSPPFPMLTIFDVSNNNFSGPLPKKYIENFDAMRNATKEADMGYMSYGNHSFQYDVSMEVMLKGSYMFMKKVLRALSTIDLSQNMIEGEIPKVIGELHGLKELNLSHNRLTGPIPQSIGRMSDLESLDLSSNKLTGGIPTELTNLNFLEVLNLSQNKLVGMIPQGKQFNTFSSDSYAENLGLCGFPLTKKCNRDPQEQPPFSWISHHGQLFGFGWQPVAVGYGCGMVFGVMLARCVFKIGKPQWIVRIVEGEPNQRVRRTRRKVR